MCPSISLFDSVIDASHTVLLFLSGSLTTLKSCQVVLALHSGKVYSIQNPRTQTLLPHKLRPSHPSAKSPSVSWRKSLLCTPDSRLTDLTEGSLFKLECLKDQYVGMTKGHMGKMLIVGV